MCFSFLDKNLKSKLFFIFIVIILTMIVETFSIALIIPVVSVILDSNFFSNYPTLSNILYYYSPLNLFDNNNSSFEKSNYLIVSCIMLFMITYLFKGVFLFLFDLIKLNFSINIERNLARNFLAGFINLPMSNFLKRNSAEMIKKTTDMVSNLSDTIMMYIILFTELFVLFGILAFTFYYEPLLTTALFFILSLFVLIFFYFTSKGLKSFGKIRNIYDIRRLKILNQIFAGIKEIKIYNINPIVIIKNYIGATNKVFFATKWNILIASLPRNLVEILAVFLISLIILYMSINLNLQNEIISTIALFGAVAFRLIPSTTKILNCIARIKFGIPIAYSLNNEIKIFKSAKEDGVNEVHFNGDIELKNCSFYYNKNTKSYILKDINLKLRKNEFIGIMGESGSGKTTFLNILLGLYPFSEGKILINNQDIGKKIRWKNVVGYVPQNTFIIDDTILNNVILENHSDKIDKVRLENAIKNAQLEKLIDELPQGVNTKIGERGSRLSVGQIQRIGIARALYVNPDILFLDEATSSLDSKTEQEFINVINKFKGKKTIFMISHKESILKSCDEVFKIDKSKIFKLN